MLYIHRPVFALNRFCIYYLTNSTVYIATCMMLHITYNIAYIMYNVTTFELELRKECHTKRKNYKTEHSNISAITAATNTVILSMSDNDTDSMKAPHTEANRTREITWLIGMLVPSNPAACK